MTIGIRHHGQPCARCGGGHTARQRCPLDPAPAAPPPDARPFAASSPAPAGAGRGGSLRRVRAWAGATTGTAVLIACISVDGYLIGKLTRAGTDPGATLAGALIAIAAGATLGLGLLFVSARAYAKAVSALLALVFVTAGFLMMVFAPVLRQLRTPQVAPERAFVTLMAFGSVALAAGLLLGAACLVWARRPHALRRVAAWSRLLATAYGVLYGLTGIGVVYSLLRLVAGQSGASAQGTAYQGIALAVVGALALTPGLVLTYHGISSMMGEGSGQFRPPVAVGWLLAWAGVLGAGGVAMAQEPPLALPMPALHVLAAALPGVVLVALVARGALGRGAPVGGLTWRQVTLAPALAMSLGVTIALYVEGIGDVAAVVLALVHHGAFRTDVWDTLARSNELLSRNEQFAVNVVAAALVAPLVEEFAKGLGVRLLMRRPTSRAQAMTLGAAAGAGFGFIEALTYGLAGVHATPAHWWLYMLVRGGSTTLHVFNTSLVALAWWYLSFGRRPRLAAALFAAAVLVHAAWNGLLVTLTSRIFGLETLDQRALEIAASIAVGAVALALLAALPTIARRLREPPAPPVAGTPLGAMAPWLGGP